MGVSDDFLAHVSAAYESGSTPLELLPGVLAEACVKVLPVAGAGISLTLDELRVPLGASDEQVARAERLQTTLGEGPCMAAVAIDGPIVFDEAMIADRWPDFHARVLSATPFRSIASVPIRWSRAGVGALDLYSTDAYSVPVGHLTEISTEIGAHISFLLFDAPTRAFDAGITMPIWLSNAAVGDRMNVWVAVGMLIEHAQLTNEAALAVLRAYASAHAETLDEIAFQLVGGDLTAALLVR